MQENHLHAITIYEPTKPAHFFALFYSLFYGRKHKLLSVTQHLPFELEHPDEFSSLQKFFGFVLIIYGELLKKIFFMPLYWENAPVLRIGKWDLKYGQTAWYTVPKFIQLCVDTGHLMLGAKNNREAVSRIKKILKKRGRQIKHIHLHENDFKTDLHLKPFLRKKKVRVIDERLIKEITMDRSFIYEDPS